MTDGATCCDFEKPEVSATDTCGISGDSCQYFEATTISPRFIVPTQPSLLIVTYRPADSSAFPTSNKQRTHIPIVLYKYTYAALLYKAIDSLVLHRHILSTAIEARRYSLVLYRQIFSITIEAHRYSVVLYRPILALVKSSARYSVVLYRQILSITI